MKRYLVKFIGTEENSAGVPVLSAGMVEAKDFHDAFKAISMKFPECKEIKSLYENP